MLLIPKQNNRRSALIFLNNASENLTDCALHHNHYYINLKIPINPRD